MVENEQFGPDDLEVVLTDTAKSKAFRYLDQHQVEAALDEHSSPVYFDADRELWLVPTTRYVTGPKLNHEREETIVLIVDVDGETLVVVTQTGDHYEWSEYDQVDVVGEVPDSAE